MSNKNTQSQLQSLKPAELLKLYKKTLGKEAVKDLAAEAMVTAILAKESEEPEVKSQPKAKVVKGWFGNKDAEKKYDLSALKIPKGHVVVRHYSNVALANGQQMEDPSTNRFQVYDVKTFESLNSQTVKGGKQLPSEFQNLGLNVEVLHEPDEE